VFSDWNETCSAAVMSRKLLAGSLVAVVGVVTVVLRLEPKAATYAYGVGDFLARDLRDRKVRVTGQLVHGTLCRAPTGCGYRFVLSDDARASDETADAPSLGVHYDGCDQPFPDLPSYDLRLSVQGERCQQCHDFQATQVVAQCTGKYEAATYAAAPPASPTPLCARDAVLTPPPRRQSR
jgi:cytochrome c-type biogenesis protein CcmE